MLVTGILSISNGEGLKYPYTLVVQNLSELCDNVIVGVDPNFPADRKKLDSLSLNDVEFSDQPWNLENREGGTEIAIQMDKLVDIACSKGADWVVVLQADELFHQQDFPMLRMFMERYFHSPITGFSTERLYFWKDLKTIRTDWNANLVRIFRPGTHSFLAEDTSKDGMFSGKTCPGEELELPYKMYHYSRVENDPLTISKRVRNLDSFFHSPETLIPEEELPEYDFTPRIHDQFSLDGFPEKVEPTFGRHVGTHPEGVIKWYNGLLS